MLESLDETLWQLFQKTGKTNYYLMYKAVKDCDEDNNE